VFLLPRVPLLPGRIAPQENEIESAKLRLQRLLELEGRKESIIH